jgi:hypothetical protein
MGGGDLNKQPAGMISGINQILVRQYITESPGEGDTKIHHRANPGEKNE